MSSQERRQRTGAPAREQPSPEPPKDIPEWLEAVRLTVENEVPLMRTLMMRAINAVLRFAALSDEAVANATSAPTDMTVLLRVLSSRDFLDELAAVEPLAPAFIRGIQAKQQLFEAHGGGVTSEQVAVILGVTRQAVENRRRAGKLIALATGHHGYRYPVWQFSESGMLRGFEDVLTVLAGHDEWMQMAFFVSRNTRLEDRTPIEMLKMGALDPVISAAEMYGEHGAA